MSHNKYEVTVAVVTYNPNNEKLILTLNSIVAQKNVNVQIVIGDDGSKTKNFDQIRQHFVDCNFSDYKIVENSVNQGTVKNLLSAVEVSDGEYVKAIGPGDLLYSENTLREWIDDMKRKKTKVGFGYTANYREYDDSITSASARAFPQDTSVYEGEKNARLLKEHYLIFEDICTGVATIADSQLMLYYLNKIAGKVKFAEDNIFRLMIFDDIKVSFYHENVILYEYGDGISTSNNSVWLQRIQDDWNAASDIMKNECKDDNAFHKVFERFIDVRDEDKYKKLLFYITQPSLLLYKIKTKLRTKKTEENIPTEFYNKCKKGMV